MLWFTLEFLLSVCAMSGISSMEIEFGRGVTARINKFHGKLTITSEALKEGAVTLVCPYKPGE